jgi:outer membrane autotransporter protein
VNGATAILDLGGTTQTQNGGVSLQAGGTIQNGTLGSSAAFDMQSGTVSAALAGTGGVSKTTAGTVTFSGANTYTGNTSITNGTLALTGAGTLGAIANAVTVNGATAILDLGGTTQTQNGGVSLQAGGTIQNGTLSSSVTFDMQSGTVSAALAGTGALIKSTGGTVTLAGINTYTGPTTVNGGTLSVNGSIASSSGLTVNAGGSIGGNGILPSTTINGGMLAPGNSIGTLSINGNLVLTSAAAYIVEVSPTQADRTNVTGTATLAGTVQAVFGPGSYIARTYTILSAAGGRSGTFGSLTTNGLPAGFAAALSYTGTDAILNLTAVLGQQPTTPGQQPLPNGALSGNQFNVANSLNSFFNNGGTLPPGFVTIFGLTGANLGNALSQLSGEAATGAQQAGFQMGSQFLNLMLDPFVDGRSGVAGTSGPALGFAPERDAALPSDIALAYSSVLKAPAMQAQTYEPRWTAWGGAYGGSNKTSGDPAVLGSHDLAARTAGFAGGLDYGLSPNSVVGLALAGGGTNWSLANGLGSGKSDAFQAGVYGATRSGPAYLAAAFAFTNHWMSTDRFAFAGDHLTASFKAQSYGGRIESGYRFATWYGGVTPYAAIQAQSFRTPGYSETDANGGGFALAYNSRTGTDTRSELGTRFDRVLALYSNAVLSLRARLAWAHDWVSDPTLAPVFQALPGASFIVNGATPAKNSALASAGTELRLANGIALLAKFDGEFASHSSTYAGTGTFRYTW